MTDRHPIEPSTFNHFLATNYPIEPDYVVYGPGGDVIAAKWHRPAGHCADEHDAGATHVDVSRGRIDLGRQIRGRSVCGHALTTRLA